MNNTDKKIEELKALRPDLPDDIIDMCVFIHNGISLAGLISSTGSELGGLTGMSDGSDQKAYEQSFLGGGDTIK